MSNPANSLRQAVEGLRDWVVEQKEFCRPPEYADMAAEELDEIRGPSAAYGAVVYGLVESRLNEILKAHACVTAEAQKLRELLAGAVHYLESCGCDDDECPGRQKAAQLRQEAAL